MVRQKTRSKGVAEETTHITISNPGKQLAFFVQLQIKRGRSEHPVLPVVWQENYVSLLPGETKTISATYDVKELAGESPMLVAEGLNTGRVVVSVKK